jgi:hypothetical protein
MRPLPWLRHLKPRDIERHPALALLGPVDAALEALVLALRALHPGIDRYPLPDEPWDLDRRRAQAVASLVRALQSALLDYHQDQLERLARTTGADQHHLPF